MKYIIFYILYIFLSVNLIFAQTIEPVVLAVSDFKNSTGIYSMGTFEKSLPEMLKTELSQSPEITIVERSKLEAVFNELALVQAGVINSDQARQVGELVDAKFVLTGEISKVGDRFRIDTQIIDVVTGRVFGEKVTGPDAASMETMVRVLARNIVYNLTGSGNVQTVQYVNQYYAPWVLAAGTGAAIITGIMHSQYNDHWNKYKSATLLSDFDKHYDKANSAYKTRNIMLGVTAGLLTTGAVLWFKSKSNGNKVMALYSFGDETQISIQPYYCHQSKAFGIQLMVLSL